MSWWRRLSHDTQRLILVLGAAVVFAAIVLALRMTE
jgi:hypothetical protein